MEYQLMPIMLIVNAHRKSPHAQRGLSLVELMISLTIGLILLLGITTLIVQQSSTRDELEKSSRQIENGRYAMQLLHDDIQLAGFYGSYFNLPAPPAAVPNPCITTPLTGSGSLDEAMPISIQGYDVAPTSTANSPLACIANANYKPGTDILVIRRASSGTMSVATAAAGAGGQVYLQTTPFGHVISNGANTAAFTLRNNTTANTSVAALRNYLVHIYFISPCDVPAGGGATCTGAADDNGRPIPTLKLLELGANGGATTFSLTPLVEGIENMQIDYGFDTDATSDGYPDTYTMPHTPPTAADWANVMAIRVNLLARNTECTTGFADSKTYTLGATTGIAAPPSTGCPAGSGYKRHVFSELVRAINPSGRRAQQ